LPAKIIAFAADFGVLSCFLVLRKTHIDQLLWF